MMKVTTNCNLNVRVGKPSVNAPSYQYLVPGCVIEVDGDVYEGDYFEGSNKWLRDITGNYYWANGTNKIEENLPWYITDFGIDLIWQKNNGAGVTIILIDSGIRNEYESLRGVDIVKDTIFSQDDGTDNYGHGTYMASVIAGSFPFYGVAKKAKIHSIKIQKRKEDTDIQINLIKGLEKALEVINKAKPSDYYIINLSLAFRNDSDKQFIDNLEQKIKALNCCDNVIITASIGNQGKNLTSKTIPAYFNDVFSCAGVIKYNGDTKLQLLGSGDIYWDSIFIASPATFDNSDLWQFLNKNGISISGIGKQGTSQACAYTSGIFALIISNLLQSGNSIDKKQIRSALKNTLESKTLESKKINVLNKENFIKQFNN